LYERRFHDKERACLQGAFSPKEAMFSVSSKARFEIPSFARDFVLLAGLTNKRLIMKHFLLAFLAVFTLTFSLQAQDPAKALKKATRDLGDYRVDPSANEAKLEEAQKLIEIAVKSDETNGLFKTWQKRGEIYNALASKEAGMVIAGMKAELSEETENAIYEAVKSFKKALSLAKKKFEKRDAANGLAEAASYLNMLGNIYLQKGAYTEAYKPLKTTLELHKLVVENGGKPIFAEDKDYNDNLFVTAYCARAAQKNEEALALYQQLYAMDYDDANIYAALFDLLSKKGEEEKALEILQAGKEKYPENTELLFAEINYYLRQGRLEELLDKLEVAIQKEPDNVSLYTTTGNVYDQLYQMESQADEPDEVKAQEYFDKAMSYYQKALELDPNDFNAIYSIGALDYNKAAAVIQEMIALESDLSREGLRKYDEKKAELEKLFNEALPWFQKAESLNPNDQNTLIALKEIYARLDDLEKSKIFRERLERVRNGEELEEPYFKQ